MPQINLEDFLKNFRDKNESEFRGYIRQEADRLIKEQFSNISMTGVQKNNLREMFEKKIFDALFLRIADDIWAKMNKSKI